MFSSLLLFVYLVHMRKRNGAVKYASIKSTPQIKVSFKLMSVGHRHLLNKYWSGGAYLRKYGIYWHKNALISYMEYLHTI